jgi:hypothetical protein
MALQVLLFLPTISRALLVGKKESERKKIVKIDE